jgi:hypothetical protein
MLGGPVEAKLWSPVAAPAATAPDIAPSATSGQPTVN